MDVLFYIQLICVLLLSSSHLGHTQKEQKAKRKQSSKQEIDPPPELMGAVKELVHPNAVPDQAMIALALRHRAAPKGMKQMMEYAPHLINLARKHRVVAPGANGTVPHGALAAFISKKAMDYVKRNGGPTKVGMFNQAGGAEQEEQPTTTPAASNHTPSRYPNPQRPAGSSHTMTMSQVGRGTQATSMNMPVPGPVHVGTEPVYQSNLLTETGSSGQTGNQWGTRWTGSPEQTGNQWGTRPTGSSGQTGNQWGTRWTGSPEQTGNQWGTRWSGSPEQRGNQWGTRRTGSPEQTGNQWGTRWTGSSGQTGNQWGTRWTGNPEQTGNQGGTKHQPWSRTNVANPGGHMTARYPTPTQTVGDSSTQIQSWQMGTTEANPGVEEIHSEGTTATNTGMEGTRQQNWGSSMFF